MITYTSYSPCREVYKRSVFIGKEKHIFGVSSAILQSMGYLYSCIINDWNRKDEAYRDYSRRQSRGNELFTSTINPNSYLNSVKKYSVQCVTWHLPHVRGNLTLTPCTWKPYFILKVLDKLVDLSQGLYSRTLSGITSEESDFKCV